MADNREIRKKAIKLVKENINPTYPFITERDLCNVIEALLKEMKEND